MTAIIMVVKKEGEYSGNSIYHDKALADTALVVDNAAYGTAFDRLYDMKGLKEWFFSIKNTGANSIDMLVEKAHKEFTDITTLVDADFLQETAEAAIVSSGRSIPNAKVQVTPEITALRIRFKESTGGLPGAALGEMGFI